MCQNTRDKTKLLWASREEVVEVVVTVVILWSRSFYEESGIRIVSNFSMVILKIAILIIINIIII